MTDSGLGHKMQEGDNLSAERFLDLFDMWHTFVRNTSDIFSYTIFYFALKLIKVKV